MTPAPLIPRRVLFGNPAYASPSISPGGTRLHFLAPDEGVMNVWVGPVDELTAAKVVTRDRRRGIRAFGFCHDDRTLFYLNDNDGDENWRLYLVDLETGEERCVTPFDRIQARLLAHNRWHPTTMLLGLNKDRRESHDVYRLDITTGELVKIADNPGYLNWVINTDLQLRGGTMMNSRGGATIYLNDPDTGEATPWLEVPFEDATSTRIAGFNRDGSALYLLSSIGANATRLYSVDTKTREQTLLAADETYDVKRVETDPDTRVPQAAVFAKDREEWVFLDDDFERAVAQIRSELARLGVDGELSIDRSEHSGRYWVVCVVAADGPVQFYIHDRDDGGLRFLFNHQPELANYRLATMEPFAFTARDDVEVHGYATWPPGVERKNLPAVVNVHGGPWTRNSWGFDDEAQWLANRGYVCVQVNFRGSLGYGKRFHNLGAKQWATAMHTDLLDAIDHLAADGAIDTSRIAIMGASYGGYAALVGAAFTPEVFRCAIDVCGPSNLLTLLGAVEPYLKPLLSFMHANVGNPETDHDMLWERSPLSRVDDITIPILVVQGANDVRVKQEEAEQIVAALAAKGLPHKYLLFSDEGHGIARPDNRETFYAAAEAFLAEHLGQPGGTTA
jgi:dipeptidyl aminopeptidase/acylaminoacyl peptidase